MVSQESYTRHRINKAEDQLRRLQQETKRKEMERYMFMHMNGDLHDFNMADAPELGSSVNQTLGQIMARMEELKRNERRQRLIIPGPLPPPPVGMGFDLAEVEEEEELDDGMRSWPYSYDNNGAAGPSGTK